MAQVNYKLVVETADGNRKQVYKPSMDGSQRLLWALSDLDESVSNFSFKTGGRFGLPPYLIQVTFGNNTVTKTDNSFWQILVQNNNMITPVGLCNYYVKDRDEIILRFMSESC